MKFQEFLGFVIQFAKDYFNKKGNFDLYIYRDNLDFVVADKIMGTIYLRIKLEDYC